MLIVLRILFVLPAAFVLACIAGAFALLWPFLEVSPARVEDPFYWIAAGTGFMLQAIQIGTVALAPWGLFALATELFGLRSLVLHVLAGLLGAFAVLRLAYGAAPPHGSVQTAIFVAGLGFALVYWLVAGRSAGRWRRPAQREEVRRIESAKPENTEANT